MLLKLFIAYFAIVVVMSLVTFIVYGIDKRRAINHQWRVPEFTLHFLAFLGGWPGASLAQFYYRHKTQKLSFLIQFWVVVLLHLIVFATIVYEIYVRNQPYRNW